MATGSKQTGLAEAIQIDFKRLHEGWMELFFPRQLGADQSVLGRWTPNTSTGWFAYRTLGAVGALIVAFVYPFLLAGFATRYHARRLDGTATRIGVAGVLGVCLVAWGALSVLAHLRFSVGGFVAVVAASLAATVSAMLAILFTRIGGRGTTVVFAYPFGVTALFLPPVVAALFSPTLSELIFPGSETFAIWILDNLLHVGGVNAYLRDNFTLTGVAYVGMWFGIAIPVGWFLGVLVTFADVIRPKDRAVSG